MNKKVLYIFISFIVFVILFVISFFIISTIVNKSKKNKQDEFTYKVLNDFLTRNTIDGTKITSLVIYYNDDNMFLELIYDFTSSDENYCERNLLAIYEYELGIPYIAGRGNMNLISELKIFKNNQYVKQKIYGQDFINKIIKEMKLKWENE